MPQVVVTDPLDDPTPRSPQSEGEKAYLERQARLALKALKLGVVLGVLSWAAIAAAKPVPPQVVVTPDGCRPQVVVDDDGFRYPIMVWLPGAVVAL